MPMKFSRNTILAIFMIGTFAIGMTEYVVTGLLTQFATDLDVPVSTTGLLLSVYAISVAVFGPILRMVTVKYSPKPLLIGLISIFIISNIVAALAPNFEVLLLSRLLSATMHAPFFGLTMSLAVEISKPEKRTSAIAAVQGGLTIAVMLGVPFGSFVGGFFDWRLVFWIIALLGAITLIGLLLVTPNIRPAEQPKLRKELTVLKNKNVLMIIAVIVFGFSGVFTAYTFKEPMLREIAGFGVTGVTIGLFLFGLGAVIGNFVSGRIHPSKLTERLIVTLAILGAVLFLFTFLLSVQFLAYVACFLFGAGTFGTTPILNSKIILAATEAPALSGTIAASVFNLANSIGATLGSLLLNSGFSFSQITFVAAGMILFGMLLMIITHKIEDKSLFSIATDK
ncbi:MFS transporter [Oceanobacillus kimchii]|uniref:MFS transporter n=1 Tax=Oceanobacillus kimchii TaxID=746691 RepID=UPI003B013912